MPGMLPARVTLSRQADSKSAKMAETAAGTLEGPLWSVKFNHETPADHAVGTCRWTRPGEQPAWSSSYFVIGEHTDVLKAYKGVSGKAAVQQLDPW